MSVNTPTANFRVAVQGVFEGDDDGFDSNRHLVVARVSAGRRLRHALERSEVIKDAERGQLHHPGAAGR